jgi:hypothetical protein
MGLGAAAMSRDPTPMRIEITEDATQGVSIRLHGGGHFPNLLGEFPREVVWKARPWIWNGYERRVLRKARTLSGPSYQLVRDMLIAERARRLMVEPHRLGKSGPGWLERRRMLRAAGEALVRKVAPHLPRTRFVMIVPEAPRTETPAVQPEATPQQGSEPSQAVTAVQAEPVQALEPPATPPEPVPEPLSERPAPEPGQRPVALPLERNPTLSLAERMIKGTALSVAEPQRGRSSRIPWDRSR